MGDLSKNAKGLIDGVVTYLAKKKEMPSAVPKLRKLLTRVSEESSESSTARVETAVALTREEIGQIEKVLSRIMGRPITVVPTVRSTCLGGMRIQIRDWIVDTTFSHSLHQFTRALME